MSNEYDGLPGMISTTPFDAANFAVACTKPRVLDVGCGYGRAMSKLAGFGVLAIGLDLSLTQLQRRDRSHPVVNADALAPPFRDATFGGALALGAIDSLTSSTALHTMLGETARVLEERAPLWLNFYTVSAEPDFRARYGKLNAPQHVIHTNSGLTVRHWSVKEVHSALQAAGFQMDRVIRLDFLSMNHRRHVPGVQVRATKVHR